MTAIKKHDGWVSGGCSTIGAICSFWISVYACGGAQAGRLEQDLSDAAFMGQVEKARKLIAQGPTR
ncbi:MAG: hypothetical protein JSW39_29850 [Desulfobacterales bacterium]|nr:MAG: hypothetical protein JSW39_29850 [Desulfobacterales bacterium]